MEEGGVEMKPVLLGAALLMLAIVSASAAPFSALYATDGLPRSPKVDAAGINRSTNVPLNQT